MTDSIAVQHTSIRNGNFTQLVIRVNSPTLAHDDHEDKQKMSKAIFFILTFHKTSPENLCHHDLLQPVRPI